MRQYKRRRLWSHLDILAESSMPVPFEREAFLGRALRCSTARTATGSSKPGAFSSILIKKHPELYCARCQRIFSSESAKQQHIASSGSHHVCKKCSKQPDFISESALDEHAVKLHNCCPGYDY